MAKIHTDESQNIEYKESWHDKYLEWVCGFANAQGGRIFIGVNDNHEIVGVSKSHELMEDIPNKIVTHLGIVTTSTSSTVPTERQKDATDSIQGDEQILSAEITQVIAQVTTQVKELIASINNESLTKGEILKLHKFKHKSNKTLLEQYFTPAMSLGLLTMEYPDVPRHPRQKYKLTEKGLVVLELIKKM